MFHEPAHLYHEKGAYHLSSHQAINHFNGVEGDYEDRPEYAIGRWIHEASLEGLPELLSHSVIGGPINPKTGRPYGLKTKKYSTWATEVKANHGSATEAVTYDVFEDVKDIARTVRSHPHVAQALEDGVPEAVARTVFDGPYPVHAQIRCDWLEFVPSDNYLWDLKTCRDITNFNIDSIAYHYPEQLAFYRIVLRRVTGLPVRKVFLIPAQKVREPNGLFPVKAIQVNEDLLKRGEDFMVNGIEKLVQEPHRFTGEPNDD